MFFAFPSLSILILQNSISRSLSIHSSPTFPIFLVPFSRYCLPVFFFLVTFSILLIIFTFFITFISTCLLLRYTFHSTSSFLLIHKYSIQALKTSQRANKRDALCCTHTHTHTHTRSCTFACCQHGAPPTNRCKYTHKTQWAA
jgi:uncharacterized paraquat-inducible protein A